MWYLEPPLATGQEVEDELWRIWHWECLKLNCHFESPERWEMSEALWAEYYG